MLDYLTQVRGAASAAGLTFESVCKAEGISRVTLWRWRRGMQKCEHDTARRLFDRIEIMKRESAA